MAERIVNRFPMTAGAARDIAEVDGNLQEVIQGTVEAARASLVGKLEPVFMPEPIFESFPPPVPDGHVPSATDEQILNEIAALRASVIKTFKHMGIDTRKFFGV